MKKSIYVSILLPAVGGLVVAIVAIMYLFRIVPQQAITVRVPVPARDIPAFTEILAADLQWRQVPSGGVEPGAIQDPAGIVGQLAKLDLVRDQQITQNHITDNLLVGVNQQVLAVNVDLVRSAGGMIRPGDTVDVYWLQSTDVPGALLASSTRVLSIQDAQGRALDRSGGEQLQNAISQALSSQGGTQGEALKQQLQNVISGQAAAAALPALVVLAVRPEEVPQVVRGGFEKSNNIILVKKLLGGGVDSSTVGQP